MGKYGINVPKGVAVTTLGDVKRAIQDVLPDQNEVVQTMLLLISIII